MTSIIKVDQIQLADGTQPTAADLELNVSGTVLQVVHGTFTTFTAVTSTTDVATSIKATITPSSTNSKILVLASIMGIYAPGGSNSMMRTSIYRGGSVRFYQQEIAAYNNSTAEDSANVMSHHLDSPASTSALEYEIYAAVSPSGTVYYNNQNGGRSMESGMTLIEIAG